MQRDGSTEGATMSVLRLKEAFVLVSRGELLEVHTKSTWNWPQKQSLTKVNPSCQGGFKLFQAELVSTKCINRQHFNGKENLTLQIWKRHPSFLRQAKNISESFDPQQTLIRITKKSNDSILHNDETFN